MKPLENTFRSDGFDFKLLKREGDVALFQKTKPNRKVPEYELVIVQKHAAKTLNGYDYPDREAMPPTSAWGKQGWSFIDRIRAEQRFADLVAYATVGTQGESNQNELGALVVSGEGGVQKLAKSFLHDGYRFTLLKRDGNVALFSKTNNGSLNYEVVIIQTAKAERVFGKDYPAREVMPSTGEWGTYGWTTYDPDAAGRRFDNEVRLQKEAAERGD